MSKSILCIDLKSFFASVECVERNMDPFTTPLVVTDLSRGKGAITLAATPCLRNLGVESRGRVFLLPKNLNIIFAKPRMHLYEKASSDVINIYKSFVSEEDILIYSIDEVFIDATNYLKYYNSSDYELALNIMNTVKNKLGLTSTCGIGPNMFLSKVAMDTEAKHNKNFISKWTYEDVTTKLQEIKPLSKIFGIGRNYEKHLNDLGIYKLKDIFKYSRDFYIKRFGNVAGNDIWCKANGIDFTRVQDANKEEREKSMSMSQILIRDYNKDESFLIIREMTDMLCRKLRNSNKITSRVYLEVRYSRELHKSFHNSISIEGTDEIDKIMEVFKYIYESNIENYPVRKLTIAFIRLGSQKSRQLSIFDKNKDEEKYTEALDKIYTKHGPVTLLRASSLLNNSTIKNREKFKNII